MSHPPTEKLSEKDLNCLATTLMQENERALEFVPKYPCHTQMVERGVKMVTKASSTVFGEKERQKKSAKKQYCVLFICK